MEYKISDCVSLKKPHPCNTRSTQFIILSIDGEVRLKCAGCGGIILIKRNAFEKAIKKTIE